MGIGSSLAYVGRLVWFLPLGFLAVALLGWRWFDETARLSRSAFADAVSVATTAPAASPLAPLSEDGLDVQDRGAVDRFEIADRDGIFLDRLDRDGVQADRVRAVGRAGREHAR